MSTSSDNKLILKIKVSASLIVLLAALHIGAGGLLIPLDMPVGLKAVIAVFLFLSLSLTLSRHALRRGGTTVSGLQVSEDGVALRYGADAVWREARVASRFIHPWVVLLALRPAGKRLATNVVVVKDAVDAEDFRRLRAALLALPRTSAG